MDWYEQMINKKGCCLCSSTPRYNALENTWNYVSLLFRGIRDIMNIVVEKETAIQVQILDKVVYIPRSADALGKSMNQTILLPAMAK